jgi:hypothetical protein
MSTSEFPVQDRTQFAPRMKNAGYVEIPEWGNDEDVLRAIQMGVGFSCGTCEYMVPAQASSTGYWCKKFSFPDRPYGCCDGYEWKGQKTSAVTE